MKSGQLGNQQQTSWQSTFIFTSQENAFSRLIHQWFFTTELQLEGEDEDEDEDVDNDQGSAVYNTTTQCGHRNRCTSLHNTHTLQRRKDLVRNSCWWHLLRANPILFVRFISHESQVLHFLVHHSYAIEQAERPIGIQKPIDHIANRCDLVLFTWQTFVTLATGRIGDIRFIFGSIYPRKWTSLLNLIISSSVSWVCCQPLTTFCILLLVSATRSHRPSSHFSACIPKLKPSRPVAFVEFRVPSPIFRSSRSRYLEARHHPTWMCRCFGNGYGVQIGYSISVVCVRCMFIILCIIRGCRNLFQLQLSCEQCWCLLEWRQSSHHLQFLICWQCSGDI